MTELVGIDHSADHLDHAVGHLKLEHGKHPPAASYPTAPGWPLTQAAAGTCPRPAPAEQAGQQPGDPLPPVQRHADRLRLTAAVRVEHHVGGEHAEQRVMSPPSAASKNLRASSPPSARRAGDGALSRPCPPAAMRCLAREKICRQFASVLPVILATSG